jgi:hypothetical protein
MMKGFHGRLPSGPGRAINARFSALEEAAAMPKTPNYFVGKTIVITGGGRGIGRAAADVPMKRLGEPEEIADLVLFMCSDACEYMTANTVCVNGGGGLR